jgi:hypothetical protein
MMQSSALIYGLFPVLSNNHLKTPHHCVSLASSTALAISPKTLFIGRTDGQIRCFRVGSGGLLEADSDAERRFLPDLIVPDSVCWISGNLFRIFERTTIVIDSQKEFCFKKQCTLG